MPNRLNREKSPYLLQHAENPVDWYPWGDEAFEKASREDKPVFLSIGYATCHWCHVMAHESFEDAAVARLLNDRFVAIKVDREERPDVDHVYMTVCQVLTGSGGWPLSVFLTPERKPFFAGTYFPKIGRMGMPGFIDLLDHVGQMWRDDRARLLQAGEQITRALQPRAGGGRTAALAPETLAKAYRQLAQSFDDTWGGFGNAPKFPTPHHLTFLLRWHRRAPESNALGFVEKTLDAMRYGGIFDQIGFGFHRYSVDQQWLVPHFEKMLYDQAMVAMAYTEAFQASGEPRYARVSREIFAYVLRDMTDPQGGFYSAEDADSEGEEGRFYVWRPEEVKEVLGDDLGDLACRFFGITAEGNFEEHRSIPHIPVSPSVFARLEGVELEALENRIEDARQKLFAHRKGRIHPLKDDKILTAWNGLMIAALARGAQALQDPTLSQAAARAADFLLETLHDSSGRLMRRYRNGEVAHRGFSDDYAFLVWGLIELYEAAFEVRYLEAAIELTEQMIDLFWDPGQGGFFHTAQDSEGLIVRDKDAFDGAIPSSNAVAALNLMRLARLTGNTDWEAQADQLIHAFSGMIADYPSGYTQYLNALDFFQGPSREIVIAGDFRKGVAREMVGLVQRAFLPSRVLMAVGDGGERQRLLSLAPFLEQLGPLDGQPTAYVCEGFACQRPITDPDDLRRTLER